MGSIPSLGVDRKPPADVSLSHYFFSLSLPLSLKSMKKMSAGKDLKKGRRRRASKMSGWSVPDLFRSSQEASALQLSSGRWESSAVVGVSPARP